MWPVHYRTYEPRDAAAITNIFPESVRGLAGQYYTTEQVEAWAGRAGSIEQVAKRCGDGRIVLVATVQNDTPIAFADMEMNGHIDMLFGLKEWARRGIASTLLSLIERYAIKNGVTRLFAEASEGAKPVFIKAGFTMLRQRDFLMGATPIHHYLVEKNIAT